MFSEITRQQFRRFRSIRRAWVSFWILVVAYVLSLFSEHLANDRPLVMRYNGSTFFPTLKFYPAEAFGGRYRTEADYLALEKTPEFAAKGGWMLYPPIKSDPLRSYLTEDGSPPHAPSARHWLGTDDSARDVAARLLYGFRSSMTFALILAVLSAAVGIVIGGIQGYAGGWFDLAGQRLIEIWSALPFLYVVILIGSIYGQTFGVLLFVFLLFEWIGLSYYMRGEFYRLKHQTFTQAAQALGAGPFRILYRHILPNAMVPVITLFPFMLIGGISSLTSLDFLGFGLPPPTPSWGEMLQQGLNHLYAPWLAFSAVMALFTTLLLASFVGEGARAAFDPRSSNAIR